MKLLVTGASGQLGGDVCRELVRRGLSFTGVTSAQMDLADASGVEKNVLALAPDAVIHCGAWTDVDGAERRPKEAFAVNAAGTQAIARACGKLNAKLMYLSTEYVFSGEGARPYEPFDPTGPLNVYGASKLAGEEAVQRETETSFIVRTAWLYGPGQRNFITKILERASAQPYLSVVGDQVGSPTYTADLARVLCNMIATERYGVYHAVNEGVCSRAEFAEEILRLAGKTVPVREVRTADFPSPAARPLNSRLDTSELERRGFSRLPPWRDALARYFRDSAQVCKY